VAVEASARVPAAATVVVKLGGEVLEPPRLEQVASQIRAAVSDGGRRMVIVHGGGPQVTAESKRRGLQPRIVAGRRITDDATRAVMQEVMPRLSAALAAALAAEGVRAAIVADAVRARRRPPRAVSGGGPTPIDLGLVGDVTGFDLDRMSADAKAAIPIIASLGRGEAGELLNINADVVAAELAIALRAAALVAVAAVGAVRRDKDDPASRIARLTIAEARAAIADGTVVGGMIPKLEEAFAPLAAGVAAVHIVGPGELDASLRSPGTVGTLVTA